MKKILIITGGSRGIGEKTIKFFLKNKWMVINISRSECSIDSVVNFIIDLSSPDNVDNHTKKFQKHIDKKNIICLVHNAAFYEKDNVASILLDNLQTTLAVNVIAPALLNKIFLPRMSCESSIIYIGSTLAEKAVPNSFSYVVSKHAVMGLMKATCQDLAGKGIHTCCINPGLVDTELLRRTMSKEIMQHLLKNKVMGKRLIAPDEIAEIIYLCATTPILNGATINADLGQTDS